MSYGNYQTVRDLLYLCALFSGIGAGLALKSIQKDVSERSKNSLLTIALCVFSAAIAVLSPALILSRGRIFFDSELLCAAIALVIIVGAAVLYPRFLAFPLTILLGVAIIALGFIFLKYPVFKDNPVTIAKITIQDDLSVSAQPIQTRIAFGKAKTFYVDPQSARLEYSIATLTLNRVFPAIGGNAYIIPMCLSIEDSGYRFVFFYPNSASDFLLSNILYYSSKNNLNYSMRLVFAKQYYGDLPLSDISKGAFWKLLFDGESARFGTALE
jgi:hypothetical protein